MVILKYFTGILLFFTVACGSKSNSDNTVSSLSNIPTNTTGATFAGNGAITSLSPVNSENSSTVVTRDSASKIIKLEFTNGLGTTTLSTAAGDTIEETILPEGTIVLAYSSDLNTQIAYVSSIDAAIGSWFKISGSTGYASVAHTGTKTTADPATIMASATYSGFLAGTLADNGFSPINTISTVNAVANFNTKSITINSTGTRGISASGADLGAYSGQNFSATISDANSDNTYEGSVTDSEGKTGTISGTLYGANATTFAGLGTTANLGNTRVHQFVFAAD